MRSRYVLIVLLVVFSSISPAQEINQSPDDKFRSGSDLYSTGKYQEALDAWLSLYNSGYRSASLSYNIGNAYFKLNNVPGSILFYERALLLKPADEDIRYNLQISRTLVVDKLAEIPELFFVTWYNVISLMLSSNIWASVSMIAFIACLIFASLYLYSKQYRNKVIGFWIALLMLITSISAFTFSARNRSLVLRSKEAIIFSPQVNGKSSPDQSGTDLFVIHEGTKVRVEDEVGEWKEIRLTDGNKGWVPANCLQNL